MKYGIWRHENALGNSAEHTYGLYKHLLRIGDKDPIIYVEKEFQKCFALCIPGISEDRIRFFEPGIFDAMRKRTIGDDPRFCDIFMPNVYGDIPGIKTYPSSWADLSHAPDCALRFPDELYEDKHSLPQDGIVIQVRESHTYHKRIEGANEDPHRSADRETFFKVAEYFADKGLKVVRIGDKKQVPFPTHKNIIDFALVDDRTMMDDLYLISKCKVFLSCDSGIWPMAGGMKKNLVMSNMTSIFHPHDWAQILDDALYFRVRKSAIIDWLPKETTRILTKNIRFAERSKMLPSAFKLMMYYLNFRRGSIPSYKLLPWKEIHDYGLVKLLQRESMSVFGEVRDNSFEELVGAIESFF